MLTGEERHGHVDACRQQHLHGRHQRQPGRTGPRPRRLAGQYGADRSATHGSTSATLQVNGNYTIGTGGGASLAVSGSAGGQGALAFNTAESGPSTLTLSGGMTVGGSSGNPALLNFNLGSGSVDTIAASGIVTVNAGGAIIGLNQLPGTSILPGTYNLITFGSGSGLGGLTFAGGPPAQTENGDTFKLVSTTGAEQLSVIMPPCQRVLDGRPGHVVLEHAGQRQQHQLGQYRQRAGHQRASRRRNTNVFFTASAASNYTNTTLDGNFSINSLTFNANATRPHRHRSRKLRCVYSDHRRQQRHHRQRRRRRGDHQCPAGPGGRPDLDEQLFQPADHFRQQRRQRRQHAHAGRLGQYADLRRDRRQRRPGQQQFGHGEPERREYLLGADPGQRPAALLLANSGALQNSTYAGGAANGLAFAPGIGTFTLGGLSGSASLTLSDTGGAAVTLQVGNNGASTTYSGALERPGRAGQDRQRLL